MLAHSARLLGGAAARQAPRAAIGEASRRRVGVQRPLAAPAPAGGWTAACAAGREGLLSAGSALGEPWGAQRRGMAKKKEKKEKDEGDEEGAADVVAESEALIKDMDEKMVQSIAAFKKEMGKLRTGRAEPGILDNVKVTAYDAEVLLSHVAQVTAPDPRTLSVNVFDAELVKAVDKAIRESGLDFNPQVAGTVIKVPIPKMTQEMRQKMSKIAAAQAENAKVGVRRIRQHCLDKIKKLELPKDDVKRQEKDVQTHTDDNIKTIEEALKVKQTELTTT